MTLKLRESEQQNAEIASKNAEFASKNAELALENAELALKIDPLQEFKDKAKELFNSL